MVKKTTLNELGKMLAYIVKAIGDLPTKEDVRAIVGATEKRLDERIDGTIVKIDGVQNTVDREVLVRTDQRHPTRIADLETAVFGKSRAPRHPA
jgi:hypothetical protein